MASGSTDKGKAPASAGDNPTPEPEPAAEAATPPVTDGKKKGGSTPFAGGTGRSSGTRPGPGRGGNRQADY